MRFAALTSVIGTGGLGTSKGLTGRTGAGARLRESALLSPRAKRRGRFPWRSGLICLAFSGLLYSVPKWNGTGPSQLPPVSPGAAPSPAWIEIPEPVDVFRLDATVFAGDAARHMARRHRTGGGRQDIWEFSGAKDDAPLLNLLIYRPGNEASPESTFYVELARRAAEAGHAVIRAEQPAPMATRFGAFEAARLVLARDGAGTKDCIGFRFANAEPDLGITGFACGGGEVSASPFASKAALACLIDQIDLAPGADDKGLIDFFAAHYTLTSPNCAGQEIDPAPSSPAKILQPGGAVPVKRQGTSRQR